MNQSQQGQQSKELIISHQRTVFVWLNWYWKNEFSNSVNQLVSQSIIMVHLIHISLELVLMRKFFFLTLRSDFFPSKTHPSTHTETRTHTHRRAPTQVHMEHGQACSKVAKPLQTSNLREMLWFSWYLLCYRVAIITAPFFFYPQFSLVNIEFLLTGQITF